MTKEYFEKVCHSGINFNQVAVLSLISAGGPLPSCTQFHAWLELCTKQGYVKDNVITDIGEELLSELVGIKEEDKKAKKETVDFVALREYLSNVLFKEIDKKQIMGFGKVYFIPTEVELEGSWNRYMKKYGKRNDFEKIKIILKNHIQQCARSRSFSPAVKYFIYKDGNSTLANAYDNFEEENKEGISDVMNENLVPTTNLFG